jgi:hypothetical protein
MYTVQCALDSVENAVRDRFLTPILFPAITSRSSQFEHSTMSSVLPFDIITQIIDNVGDNEDKNLLKELALVPHSCFQICS